MAECHGGPSALRMVPCTMRLRGPIIKQPDRLRIRQVQDDMQPASSRETCVSRGLAAIAFGFLSFVFFELAASGKWKIGFMVGEWSPRFSRCSVQV